MFSIKARLAFLTMFSFASLLGVSGFSIFYFARENMMERLDQKLRIQAYSIMTATYQREDRRVEVHFTDRFLHEFDGNQRKAFYQIWRDDESIVKRSDSLLSENLPVRYGKEHEPDYWSLTLPNGLPGRAIGVRYSPRVRGNRRGDYNPEFELILVVATDLQDVEESLAGLRNLLLITGLLTGLCTPLLIIFALGRGLRPLKGLANKMDTVDERSLETRFEVESLPEELQPIANQLNSLMQRLGNSFDRERRFSADVAHELRTPIAALRNISEVGLKWDVDDPKKDYQAVNSISMQMERTVLQLLDLSRCDNDQLETEIEQVDLKDLVDDSWILHKTVAESRQVAIEFRGLENLVWKVDRRLMGRVIDNLLENAASYTNEGSTIEVAANEEKDTLSITNSCDDLKETDLEKMFDRFWRSDAARSSELHSGLGLSIAKAFSSKLGLRIETAITDDNLFTIRLVKS